MLYSNNTRYSNKHENQYLLKGLESGFSFQFSSNSANLYLSELNQNISYGWQAPQGSSNDERPVTQFSYKKDKTQHTLDLSGFIYVNSELGTGLDNFKKFKEKCNEGEIWNLVDADGRKISGSGNGDWYVSSIRQKATDFISGMNALKISFGMVLNKY